MNVQWRDIRGVSDEDAARLVRDDRIDILVDLTGHIANNRLLLFARKPAPVQVTYLGYQATTGMSAMDYRISDEHSDPSGTTERYYAEKLLRLPGSFFCYESPPGTPEVNALPALAGGSVTFASLNHVNKFTPQAFAAWSRILAEVPNSRLVVLAYTPGELEHDLRQIAAQAGVAPSGSWCKIAGRSPNISIFTVRSTSRSTRFPSTATPRFATHFGWVCLRL